MGHSPIHPVRQTHEKQMELPIRGHRNARFSSLFCRAVYKKWMPQAKKKSIIICGRPLVAYCRKRLLSIIVRQVKQAMVTSNIRRRM